MLHSREYQTTVKRGRAAASIYSEQSPTRRYTGFAHGYGYENRSHLAQDSWLVGFAVLSVIGKWISISTVQARPRSNYVSQPTIASRVKNLIRIRRGRHYSTRPTYLCSTRWWCSRLTQDSSRPVLDEPRINVVAWQLPALPHKSLVTAQMPRPPIFISAPFWLPLSCVAAACICSLTGLPRHGLAQEVMVRAAHDHAGAGICDRRKSCSPFLVTLVCVAAREMELGRLVASSVACSWCLACCSYAVLPFGASVSYVRNWERTQCSGRGRNRGRCDASRTGVSEDSRTRLYAAPQGVYALLQEEIGCDATKYSPQGLDAPADPSSSSSRPGQPGNGDPLFSFPSPYKCLTLFSCTLAGRSYTSSLSPTLLFLTSAPSIVVNCRRQAAVFLSATLFNTFL